MAGSSDDQWRRHADMDDELKEGEYVPGPGYHSADTEEYYNHYSSSESDDDEATSKTRWYFVATSNGDASCLSSVAANNNGYCASSSSAAAAPPALACRVCGKEFTSSKAVCGHMKVHALERQEQGNGKEKEVKRIVAVARSWGVTGKRGCSSASGSRSVSPNSELDNSMAIVPAEPKLVLQSMPLAYAATNLPSVRVASEETYLSGEGSSAQPIHNDAMAIVVAGADPPIEAVAHHQAASPSPPLPAGDQASPVHRQRAAAPAAGTQNRDGYTCGECGMWFRTHQALGGHVAAHKNNRRAAAAAAGMHQDGAVPCRGGSKLEKRHPCKECPAEFATGVQLGGHMRKHWKGDPIVPKKKQRLIQPIPPPAADLVVPQLDQADDNGTHLRLALPFEADAQSPAPGVARVQPAPAPAEVTVEAVQPAPEPPLTGRVLLFGIDIGPGVKRPRTREGSPATKDSADIGGQQ